MKARDAIAKNFRCLAFVSAEKIRKCRGGFYNTSRNLPLTLNMDVEKILAALDDEASMIAFASLSELGLLVAEFLPLDAQVENSPVVS